MKQKDIAVLVGIGLFAAIISVVIAGKFFNSPKARSTSVPVVTPINGTFPDIHNDTQYSAIFNDKSLDPTQLIKIGTNQNQQPFSGQ